MNEEDDVGPPSELLTQLRERLEAAGARVTTVGVASGGRPGERVTLIVYVERERDRRLVPAEHGGFNVVAHVMGRARPA